MAAFWWAVGWLGCVPLLGLAAQDAGLAWGWAGLVLPACGALAAGCPAATTAGRSAAAGLSAGALAAGLLLWLGLPALPRPGAGLLALTGLAGLGAGLAAWCAPPRGGRAWPGALPGLLLLVSAGLCLAPGMGGLWGPAPWTPEVAARLLRWAPSTLVAEAGGLDWLRHSSVYEPVGGDSIGPGLHRPWGVLAGALPGVVGFAAGALRRLLPRAAPAD